MKIYMVFNDPSNYDEEYIAAFFYKEDAAKYILNLPTTRWDHYEIREEKVR
jgi:hypothetical protein